MNQWVRIGLVVLLVVFGLRFAFGLFKIAMALVSTLFPLAILAGVGLIVYGLIWGNRKSLRSGHRGYLED